MKRLPVTAPAYRYIEQSFKEWLDILGYSWQAVYYMPVQIRGLLHYLEQAGKTQLTDITVEVIKDYYYGQLKQRTNCMRGAGTLSNEHLNKHLQALRKFTEYLRQTGRLPIALLGIEQEPLTGNKPAVLTPAQIQQLYEATLLTQEPAKYRKSPEFYTCLGMRDRALLSIFYGCGLRRNEGYHLDYSDINLDSGVVHVRKGKNYKERFVPISKQSVTHLAQYRYDARPVLVRARRENAFFVSHLGKRLGSQMLFLSVQSLVKKTGDALLLQKDIGLHTLRHSIATHLLARGMSLENIAAFLGHQSLESTQIYTHLMSQEDEQV